MARDNISKEEEALKLLKDIRHTIRLIEEYQCQIDEIQAMLTSTTVKPKEVDVQTSGAADPMADKIIVKMEYIAKLESLQEELVKKKMKALDTIKLLDVDEQRILLMKYFDRYSTEEIGERIGYTYRWAWEKIHIAEEHFIDEYQKTT